MRNLSVFDLVVIAAAAITALAAVISIFIDLNFNGGGLVP